jgi:hypothetical protein
MADPDPQSIWYKRGRRAGFVEGLVFAMIIALCAGVWIMQAGSLVRNPEPVSADRPTADPE